MDIAYHNKAAVYGLLLKASAHTLLTIGADPKHFGAKINITSVLHTWGFAMMHHSAERYGPGGYRGVHVDFLFSQRNTPVCSPSLISGGHPLGCPDDLRHHTLLHVDWMDTEASWRMWLLAAGIDDINATRGPHFTQEGMAVQAAFDGQGVALIGDKLIADHLASGRLVCPFGPDISTLLTFSHYLLTPHGVVSQPKVTAFREWLIEEVREAGPTSD